MVAVVVGGGGGGGGAVVDVVVVGGAVVVVVATMGSGSRSRSARSSSVDHPAPRIACSGLSPPQPAIGARTRIARATTVRGDGRRMATRGA